jgi:hypothetical protein
MRYAQEVPFEEVLVIQARSGLIARNAHQNRDADFTFRKRLTEERVLVCFEVARPLSSIGRS